jgi:hypothetical protein
MSNTRQKPVSPRQNRRNFLKTILATSLAPLVVPASVLGRGGAISPNNRIVFGVIGFGNRAKSIIQSFMAFKEVQKVGDLRIAAKATADEGCNIVNAYYNNQDSSASPIRAISWPARILDATFYRHGYALVMEWLPFTPARAGKDYLLRKNRSALSMNEGR